MRILIQRVKSASVSVDSQIIGQIGKGALLFLGIHKDDDPSKIEWMINKLLSMRIFPDSAGKMNLDMREVDGDFLVVSQFTLYGNLLSGRRPDFIESANPEKALDLYKTFIDGLQKAYSKKVETGVFGARMEVLLVNDGPVTFLLER